MPTIMSFFPSFFGFLLTVGTFTSVFPDKKLGRSHNSVEIKVVFLLVGRTNTTIQLLLSCIKTNPFHQLQI